MGKQLKIAPGETVTLSLTSFAPQPAPHWLTVSIAAAIVRVPERGLPEFGPTLTVTEPFPEPEAPDRILAHGTLLVAVHAQPGRPVTATLTVPPERPNVFDVGLMA